MIQAETSAGTRHRLPAEDCHAQLTLILNSTDFEAAALITAARQRNPGSSAYYESDLALCAYFSGDYPLAAMWIKKSPAPSNAIYHVIAAAVFGEGGYKIDADRDRAWLNQNQPDLVKNMRQVASAGLARSQDVDFIIGSLRKAGLTIAD